MLKQFCILCCAPETELNPRSSIRIFQQLAQSAVCCKQLMGYARAVLCTVKSVWDPQKLKQTHPWEWYIYKYMPIHVYISNIYNKWNIICISHYINTTNPQLKTCHPGFLAWVCMLLLCWVDSAHFTRTTRPCSNLFHNIFKLFSHDLQTIDMKCYVFLFLCFFLRKFGSQKGLVLCVWPYLGKLGPRSFFSLSFRPPSSFSAFSSSSSSQKLSRHDIPRVSRAHRVPWSLLFGLIGISGAAWETARNFSWNEKNEKHTCFFCIFYIVFMCFSVFTYVTCCFRYQYHCWHFHIQFFCQVQPSGKAGVAHSPYQPGKQHCHPGQLPRLSHKCHKISEYGTCWVVARNTRRLLVVYNISDMKETTALEMS